jgi:hypothetical protein
MTLEGLRSLRRDRIEDRAFASRAEGVPLKTVGDADRQERAVIRAPTALEVAELDRSRKLPP